MTRSAPSSKKFNADSAMRKLAWHLVRDFQATLDDPLYCCELLESLNSQDIERIRSSLPTPNFSEASPYKFKVDYQINSVFKRYRFKKDLYTDADLNEDAIRKFVEVQERLRQQNLDRVDTLTTRVIDFAAYVIAQILGPYDAGEHQSLCRFGRKASVGIPSRLANLAERWEWPISGSLEQVKWFHQVIDGDELVSRYWANRFGSAPSNGATYRLTDKLTLTLVPKSFKSVRAIMPNTTIGSFYSLGVGEMIRKRLKKVGCDISRQQMLHRDIARDASVHMRYVTADLSSASDSISVELVRRLLPDDWFDELNSHRIAKVLLPNGTSVESLTFCTMGIGYTFPLQTLIFSALLIAIQSLTIESCKLGKISVYGDDLIYHGQIHNSVLTVFPQLGFVINEDKTFCDGGFRESCGGDYFRGVDVRPFQPRNGSAIVCQKAYEAVLYKWINGLLARWSEHEVSGTLHFLCSEIERCTGSVKTVPLDFPDDSGVKISLPCHSLFLRGVRVAWPKSVGHGLYRFSYLRIKSQTREEVRHDPFYWQALGGYCVSNITDWSMHPRMYQKYPVPDLIDQVTGISDAKTESLLWKEAAPQTFVRSKLTGRRLRRQISETPILGVGRYVRQSGISNFENP